MCSAKSHPALYADVVLPLAVPKPYTYAIPEVLAALAKPGMRVVVQVGARKLYTGLIAEVHRQAPQQPTKEILDFLEDKPVVTQAQLDFWRWMATYYMCYLGEVMNAAMPSGLKLQSESSLRYLPGGPSWENLGDGAYLLMEALENRSTLSVQDAAKILEVKNPLRVVHQLMEMGLVMLDEELHEQAKPKTTTVLSLAKAFSQKELQQIFEDLNKSPKQSELLLAYFKIKNHYKDGLVPEAEVLKEAGASRSSLTGLLQKEVLQRSEVLSLNTEKNVLNLNLSPAQQVALAEIERGFAEKKPVLLHGVTGSGKTEIYISLLKKALLTHKRALYLVPEIALTTQLIARLEKHFGNQVVIYHSRLNQGERQAAYKRLMEDEQPLLLLGARSALLLPLPDLGCIVVDEEHDASFKQQDPSPRYQARDSALMLAHMAKCPIVLGSATPSAESYYHANAGRYALANLHQRFGGVQMPDMQTIDIRKQNLWKTMRGNFAPQLIEEVKQTLAEGKKVILFQNRRGYSPIIRCEDCGHTHECPNCDITLTYHKYSHLLRCHYCGYSTTPQPACPKCGGTDIKEVGFGTEKLEEELALFVPEANIHRLDWDSTRRKNAFSKIIARFASGDLNVLIGTQMVTKGLDFDDVTLVGILNADTMLHYPDFRAQERAFQLLEQVAGRAGRRNQRGRVAIQTYRPDHRIIQYVLAHDYHSMIEQLLAEREVFKYPPYTRLIQIELRHREREVVHEAAAQFANTLLHHLGERVLGPEWPPVARLKNIYRKTILLKLERDLALPKVKDLLWRIQTAMQTHANYKSVRVIFDVDPN